ncbi:protocatechuate 3,4-dioxygenase [Archangium minus]|uniref:Protocatechuate 3,4-dioxygenase n=1 Tax=Archangium minus TaxID=83450 RepID=A0ABY9WJ99_9BACT|nr:protocatechuate 3,4-dioxygenase [Archangium minus]
MSTKTKSMTRRGLLGAMGLAVVALPLPRFLAWAKQPAKQVRKGWATGGTAAMTGASAYPNPFTSQVGAACKLTCEQVVGPCYGSTKVRKDISEGHAGLPVRLAFRILDETCKPIPGASVDIWHAGPEGVYSGDDQHPLCNPHDEKARAAHWFRGVQTTNDEGRVDFNTCFPGWYKSRTVHIHFTIKIAGTESVTSQLYFEDSLNDDILSTQALYNTRGVRDTRNSTDKTAAPDKQGDFVLQTQKMSDGALLAWKTFIVRSSTGIPLCNASSEHVKALIKSGVNPADPNTFPSEMLSPEN